MWQKMYERSSYRDLPWFSSKPTEELVDAVKEGFFPAGTEVLDIGCGAGTNLLYLAQKKFKAHGVDLSPVAIRTAAERAREAGAEVDARVGDALELPFRRAQMGAVLDRGCFHTLPVRRRPEYAREVARVLRPDGAFLLTWVGRESSGNFGPPHRPSLAEVALTLEPSFIFQRTWFTPATGPNPLSSYAARMTRRSGPQPPPR